MSRSLNQVTRSRLLPCERIAADGIVVAGTSDLDRSLITGESQADHIAKGGTVNAGMMNLTGPLTVRITATGDQTLLAEIARMVGCGRGVAARAMTAWRIARRGYMRRACI